MADVAYALSRISVSINGRVLANLRGAAKPETMDATPTRIMAGGKKGIAFNEYPDANAVDYPFTLAAPSGDERFLDDLIERSQTVSLIVAYTDTTDWPKGAYTGITGRGKLSHSTRQDGDEIGENAYVVHLNGFSKTYHQEAPITKV